MIKGGCYIAEGRGALKEDLKCVILNRDFGKFVLSEAALEYMNEKRVQTGLEPYGVDYRYRCTEDPFFIQGIVENGSAWAFERRFSLELRWISTFVDYQITEFYGLQNFSNVYPRRDLDDVTKLAVLNFILDEKEYYY
jgi:hypothetical protein